MTAFIHSDFFEFFKALAAHNNKDWFDENRQAYIKSVKEPFEKLCAALISELSRQNPLYLQLKPADVIFRINRDIRFSKDKTPYKLNRSALITPEGKKSMAPTGFYFELGPGGNTFYCGAYMPQKPELKLLREYIADHLAEFQKIVSEKAFKDTFQDVLGEKNKRVDVSLKEASNHEPLLFNTQFYVKHKLPESICTTEKLVKYLLDLEKKASPFANFLQKGLHGA